MPKNHTFKGLDMRAATTLGEALTLYGMDFPVETRPLYFFDNKDRQVTSPRNQQVVNGDTLEPMGVVGLGYTKVDYAIAFSPADALIEGGARIVGGSCPNHRERAYLLLEADGVINLSPGDTIVNRFLLMSSHDGTGKIEVRMTPWRERTGTAITTDASRPLSFKHTRNVVDRVGRARQVFKRVNTSWEEFSAGVQRMVGITLTEEQAKSFIESVLPSAEKEISARLDNIRSEVLTIFRDTGIGTRLPKCKGTLFGLVQAFTEWADIKKTVRKSTKRDDISAGLDARLVSDSAKRKQKAWAMALWLMKQKNMSGALS